MKLKRVLRMIDFMTTVKIAVDKSAGDKYSEEELFKGSVLDVPWCFADYEIDESTIMESIYLNKPKEENDDCYITIYVIENDD